MGNRSGLSSANVIYGHNCIMTSNANGDIVLTGKSAKCNGFIATVSRDQILIARDKRIKIRLLPYDKIKQDISCTVMPCNKDGYLYLVQISDSLDDGIDFMSPCPMYDRFYFEDGLEPKDISLCSIKKVKEGIELYNIRNCKKMILTDKDIPGISIYRDDNYWATSIKSFDQLVLNPLNKVMISYEPGDHLVMDVIVGIRINEDAKLDPDWYYKELSMMLWFDESHYELVKHICGVLTWYPNKINDSEFIRKNLINHINKELNIEADNVSQKYGIWTLLDIMKY